MRATKRVDARLRGGERVRVHRTGESTASTIGGTLGVARESRLELIISRQLPQEIPMVLARPRRRKRLFVEEALRFVAELVGQTTLMADPPGPHPAVFRDPDDDYLVPLATTSGADANRHRDLAPVVGHDRKCVSASRTCDRCGRRRWTRSDRVEVERGMDCPCQVDLLLVEEPPYLLSQHVCADGRDVVTRYDAAIVETVGGSAEDLG
jgi:hypothetical protein